MYKEQNQNNKETSETMKKIDEMNQYIKIADELRAEVEKGAKSYLIDLSKRKNFDHLSFVKSGPSHIELDGCVAGTQIVTILDYTSVTSVRMLNEKMIWE